MRPVREHLEMRRCASATDVRSSGTRSDLPALHRGRSQPEASATSGALNRCRCYTKHRSRKSWWRTARVCEMGSLGGVVKGTGSTDRDAARSTCLCPRWPPS
jgi:hypothetical protein